MAIVAALATVAFIVIAAQASQQAESARGEVVSASLDHAVWFHDDFRADEWLLYATDSPWSDRGRGFNRGRIFTQDGRLVASVAQEGMIRRATPKG